MDLLARLRPLIIQLGIALLTAVDRILVRYSRLGDPARFDTAQLPWAAELERNWTSIRDEAEEILREADLVPPLRRLSADHHKIAIDDKWRSFFLWGYGVRVDPNCRRCPRTAALVEQIPGMQTALFSILAPGTHIPLHNGATKAILTGHLGLRVPRERQRCHISVDGEDYSWTEGEVFVFDDMRMHEAWNDTDEPRVILMMHVARPQRFPGNVVRAGVMALVRKSPYVKDAHAHILRWPGRSLTEPAAEQMSATGTD
jgi:beta-hydroxylase